MRFSILAVRNRQYAQLCLCISGIIPFIFVLDDFFPWPQIISSHTHGEQHSTENSWEHSPDIIRSPHLFPAHGECGPSLPDAKISSVVILYINDISIFHVCLKHFLKLDVCLLVLFMALGDTYSLKFDGCNIVITVFWNKHSFLNSENPVTIMGLRNIFNV